MNHYGALAEQHWQKYRPQEYQAMSEPERETFFTQLGDQIAGWVQALEPDFETPAPPNETFVEKVQRLNWARLEAEEQVLRETLPQSEAEDAEQPEENPLAEDQDPTLP
jgi:hypothetical protein